MKAIAVAASAVLFLSIAGSVSPQQGAAVSLERCRSDLTNWTHNFKDSDSEMALEEKSLTYDQLRSRADEAIGCRNWDGQEPYFTAATKIQMRYSGQVRDRLYDFVVRHNMAEEFQKEDANGLR